MGLELVCLPPTGHCQRTFSVPHPVSPLSLHVCCSSNSLEQTPHPAPSSHLTWPTPSLPSGLSVDVPSSEKPSQTAPNWSRAWLPHCTYTPDHILSCSAPLLMGRGTLSVLFSTVPRRPAQRSPVHTSAPLREP